jgi:hypothetical protein
LQGISALETHHARWTNDEHDYDFGGILAMVMIILGKPAHRLLRVYPVVCGFIWSCVEAIWSLHL